MKEMYAVLTRIPCSNGISNAFGSLDEKKKPIDLDSTFSCLRSRAG